MSKINIKKITGHGNVVGNNNTTSNKIQKKVRKDRLKLPVKKLDLSDRQLEHITDASSISTEKNTKNQEKWDAFISHASEDKETFVKKLATSLMQVGVNVWYDEFTLKVGMSLSASIDKGLSKSSFGILVLSKSFIEKRWTDYEKKSLVAREVNGKDIILPIWFGVTKKEVIEFSPYFADKVSLSTDKDSFEDIILKLLEVIRPDIYENLHRRLLFEESIKKAKTTQTKISAIRLSKIRHKTLPQSQINRIKNIHNTIGRFLTNDIEKSIEDFKRDMHPEKEIKIWETMCATFNDFINKYNIHSEKDKKEIAIMILMFSFGGLPKKSRLTDTGIMKLAEIWNQNFHANETNLPF